MKKIRSVTVALMLLLSLLLLPAAGLAAPGADFALAPAAQTVNVGDVFSVTIRVNASAQAVDTVQVGVNFDPAVVRIVNASGAVLTETDDKAINSGVITLTDAADASFPDRLSQQVNNTTGQITFALGIGFGGGSPVEENLVLGSIRFKALAATEVGAMKFETTNRLRATLAARAGDDVTGTRTDATVTIRSASAPTPPPSTPPSTTPPPASNPSTPVTTPPSTTTAPSDAPAADSPASTPTPTTSPGAPASTTPTQTTAGGQPATQQSPQPGTTTTPAATGGVAPQSPQSDKSTQQAWPMVAAVAGGAVAVAAGIMLFLKLKR